MNTYPGKRTEEIQGHLQDKKYGNSVPNLLENYNKENQIVHCLNNEIGIAHDGGEGQFFHQIFIETVFLVISSSIDNRGQQGEGYSQNTPP